MMPVEVDETLPKCPKCHEHCSDAYRCKFCNCNMHWFCSVVGGIEGHGAKYVCITCGSKKQLSANQTASKVTETTTEKTISKPPSPQFRVLVGNISSKSHKMSPIWEYFAHFDPVFHPDMKNYRICLLCRKEGHDKALSVGERSSLGTLTTHLNKHPNENEAYNQAMANAELEKKGGETAKKNQGSIASHFSTVSNTKTDFLNSFARWTVADDQPLSVGESKEFRAMIRVANLKLVPPDNKQLKRKLQITKESATLKMKAFLQGKHFSMTLDHWTSLANENYAALTLHTIHQFELKQLTLSCCKHEGGSTAAEMDDQLMQDLASWTLSEDLFVALVTDTAANMNKLGQLVEEKFPDTIHHYCADHNLQLTSQKSYTGDIVSRLGGETARNQDDEPDVVDALKKARDLVSHIDQSPAAKAKLDSAQKRIFPDRSVLVLIQDVKTRWWSTYMMLERILFLKLAIQNMFEEEFRNREHQNKKTALEAFALSDDEFKIIQDVVYVLAPFKNAQESLEGSKYVNLSLLPKLIDTIRMALTENLGATDSEENPQLYAMLSEMNDDFQTRWCAETTYSSRTIRADRCRIHGVPKLAFWASMLDPRTKNSTTKIMSGADRRKLWDDMHSKIIELRRQKKYLKLVMILLNRRQKLRKRKLRKI